MPPKTATPSTEVNELEVLFPNQAVETSAGTFIIHPFWVKDFTAVIALIKSYRDLMAPNAGTLFDQILLKGEEGLADAQRFISFCCNTITPEQFNQLRMDELVDLFMSAVECNRDFLLQRMQQSGVRMQIVASLSTGQMLLSDS